MTLKELSRAKLNFICGKGGVGKTTVSGLLADYFANYKNLKVLLISLNDHNAHRDYLNQIDSKIDKLNLTPKNSLKAFTSKKMLTKIAYNFLLKHEVVQSFIRFVPGLDELVMMGQVIDFVDNKNKKYDKIIIDLPATGHGVRFLNIAQVAYEGAKVGPLAQAAKDMADFLRNENNAVLHLVTLLEELPVLETVDLRDKILENKSVNIGNIFANGVYERLCGQEPPLSLGEGINKIIKSREFIEKSQAKYFHLLESKFKNHTHKIIELPKIFERNKNELISKLARDLSYG